MKIKIWLPPIEIVHLPTFFVQTIQQIEVYKGSNGAHFGPDAIGGAINFITDVNNYTELN